MEKKNDKGRKEPVLDILGLGNKEKAPRFTCIRLSTGAVEIRGPLTFAHFFGLEPIPGLTEC